MYRLLQRFSIWCKIFNESNWEYTSKDYKKIVSRSEPIISEYQGSDIY